MNLFSLKAIIFALFGNYEKVIDSNKDLNGKGTTERVNESVAEDFDEELEPYIRLIIENVVNPTTCFERYVGFLEVMSGNDSLYPSQTIAVRRAVQHYIRRYWQIKGTRRFIEVLLSLIGLGAAITESEGSFSFDSAVTFDDEIRTWDLFCNPCVGYSVDVTRLNGDLTPLSPAEIQGVMSVIDTNQPINTYLVSLSFNGTPIL